jgi:DNA-binding MarR family transcriptional regulator
MSEALKKRLKQVKGFKNPEEEVFLAIQVLAEDQRAALDRVFKDNQLTGTQYNVLRILRGAGQSGLSCREISERMITRDSDITRMLDRLEVRGLIRRERQSADRRVVMTFITDDGLELLRTLDTPVAKTQQKLFSGMSRTELNSISRILEKMLTTK